MRTSHQFLRLLASVVVSEEPKPGTYALNEVSELLGRDHPASLRDMAVMNSADSHRIPCGKLGEVVRSGRSGAHHAFGTEISSWFQQHGNRAEGQMFNCAMRLFSSGIARLVIEAYDVFACRHIIDVGGGHGLLIFAVLDRVPGQPALRSTSLESSRVRLPEISSRG